MKIIFYLLILIFQTLPDICLAQTPVSTAGKDNSHEDYLLGVRFYKEKKYKEALKPLAATANSGDDDGDARILLGHCYYELKQYAKALESFRMAAKDGKKISLRNRAQSLARTVDLSMKGICPGNCLKLSTPGWKKMNVPGTPSRLVWMVFPYLDPEGKGGSEYWSNDHVGEVIEYVNGRPINRGPCPICKGTGKISLPK